MKGTRVDNHKKLMNDSYAFLEKQLEVVDPKIKEPLSGTDWPRDMPVKTGEGIVENVSVIDVSYASSGGDEDALFMDNTNDIPVIQADFGKQVARVFNFQEYIKIGWLDQQKCRKMSLNIEETLNRGIRLHQDKIIDRNVYIGFAKYGSTGLLNNPNIVRGAVATGASGQTDWAHKTADEILDDVNKILSQIWEDNDCASDALPNHILIPVEQYGAMVTRKVSHDSERSIITYIKENNLATQQGTALEISPSKFCKGAGANGTDRMVAYRNQEERIRFSLTVPLKHLPIEIREVSFFTPFFSQFSEVQFIYPTLVRYADGI